MEGTIEIFLCYAREDEEYRQRLEKQLSIFKREGLVRLWHDGNISPGEEWEQIIHTHLNTAQIVLLLVSPDFIASNYCYSVEMQKALERHARGETHVIPVIARPIHLDKTPLGKLQALPKNAKPIALWRHRDEAFFDVAEGVLRVIEEIETRLTSSPLFDQQQENSEQKPFFGCPTGRIPSTSVGSLVNTTRARRVMMDDTERAYREAVIQEHNALGFAGFGRAAPGPHQLRLEQVRLEDIFVRLRLTTEQEELHRHDRYEEDRAARGLDKHQQEQDRPIALGEALGKPLLLVGEPGAGKSTLLRWLAVTFAQGRQRDPDRIGPMADADRLPILIELGRLSDDYLKDESRLLPYWQVLLPEMLIRQARFRNTPQEMLQQALKDGHCLLLFDGLDEIANRQARARLARSLTDLHRLYPGNTVVVGSRPAGLTGESEGALRPVFQRCQIQRFTPEDFQRFFRFWYRLDQMLQPAVQQREADALSEKIKATPGMLRLAGTPLLATLMLLIWRKEGSLPERRVDLYERCCRTLVEEWERSHDVAYREVYTALDTEQQLRLLSSIAYAIHRQEQRTNISQDEVRLLLEEGLRNEKGYTTDLTASRFLETLALRSGLLQFQGDGLYGFPHLTFQEYLAARHIAAQPDPAAVNEVMEHLHEAWWQEVHLLTIGRLGSGKQGAAQTEVLLCTILHRYRPPSRFLRPSQNEVLRFLASNRWILGVQLARRLAWLLRREEAFALWGAAECTPDGLPTTLRDELAERAAALAWEMLIDPVRRPLLDAWLSIPGRRLPPQASREISQILTSALHDPDWPVRQAAAASLGQVGSGNEAVISALLNALHDPGVSVRQAAAASLSQVGSGNEAVISALLDTLHDPDWRVCQAAAASLGQVGSGQETVISTLLNALRDGDESVRQAAAASLSQVGSGNEAVISALLDALHNGDISMRFVAANILGQVGSGQEAVISALLDALHNGDESVRQAAAASLGQIGSGQEAVTSALLDTLLDTDRDARQAAAASLGQVGSGNEAVAPALLNASLHDTDRDVRQVAATSLAQVSSGQEAIIPVLLNALHDPDWHVRQAAAASLGQVGSGQEAAIPALLDALHDRDWRVRQAAAVSLGQVGNGQEAVVPALLNALRDGDESVRQAAAASLGQVGSDQEAIIPVLLEALQDPGWGMRRVAMQNLGQMKITNPGQLRLTLMALHRCLYAMDRYERRNALEAINQLVNGRALPDSHWKPVLSQTARSQRRRLVGRLAAVTLGLLALILGAAWLSDIPPFNSLFAGLSGLVALIAAVATFADVTLRDLWNHWNRDGDQQGIG